jgi:hypothetical protein
VPKKVSSPAEKADFAGDVPKKVTSPALADEFLNAGQSRVLWHLIADHLFLAPTFQVGEIHLHLADILFLGDGIRKAFVHLVHKLGAVLYHLIHRAVLQELPVLVAVDAVIFIPGSIGIGAKDFIRERHSATLTKLHFHMTLYYFAFQI